MTSLEICEKEKTRTSMHISYLRNRPLLKMIVNVKFSGRKPKRKNLRYEELFGNIHYKGTNIHFGAHKN